MQPPKTVKFSWGIYQFLPSGEIQLIDTGTFKCNGLVFDLVQRE